MLQGCNLFEEGMKPLMLLTEKVRRAVMELPSGTLRELLAEKHDLTTGKPATTYQLYQLAEKLNRKYSTAFEAREFKAKIQKQLRKSA